MWRQLNHRGFFQVTPKGIEVWGEGRRWLRDTPDHVIPWTEVRDTIRRGATPELRSAYERACEEWGAHHDKWEPYERYWDADRPRYTDELRVQNYQEWKIASDGMNQTREAILDHGLERESVQEPLFEMAVPEVDQGWEL